MTDAVVSELRGRIVSGALAPGSRIDINEIATELGVSQTPVREAILQLQAWGMVDRQPYRGTVVTGIDAGRFEEVTALRIDLEGRAALLGVARLSEADLERMRGLQDELVSLADAGELDSERFNRLNREFHGVIYRAADSPSLLRLVELLQDEADLIRLRIDMEPPMARAFHADILAACVRRDAGAACEATRAHLLESYLAVRGVTSAPDEGILADVLRDARMETTR